MFFYICNKFLCLILFIYSFYKLILFIKYLTYKLLLPLFWVPINFKDFGQWAVITGCTDGIGKAFAFELAKQGMDLVLISRSKTKLDEVAEELSQKYRINTKIIVADFRNSHLSFETINKELDDIDPSVLINNVGTALPVLIDFTENKRTKVNDMIEVNIKSTLFMCSAVIDKMISKKKGVIINISSVLSCMRTPGATVYSATKAFILKFSKDLNSEYKKHGIMVHCLITGPVTTKLFNVKITKWITPTPDVYVRNALKTIGISKVTTGYSSHDIIEFLYKLADEISPSLVLLVLSKIGSLMPKNKKSKTL